MNQSRGGPPQELFGRENWRHAAELEAQQKATRMGYTGVHSVDDGYEQQHGYSPSPVPRKPVSGAESSTLAENSSTPTTYHLDSASSPRSSDIGWRSTREV